METFIGWIVWLGLCFLFAHWASKGRVIDYWWAFVLCLVTSPLIGLIIAAIFSPKKESEVSDD